MTAAEAGAARLRAIPNAPPPRDPDDPLYTSGPENTPPTREPPDDEPDTGRRIRVTPASTMTLKRAHWLWEDRIPQGEITLLAGKPGIGKSTAAYTKTAQISRGTLKGRFYGRPRNVLVVADEDSWEHTILGRLIAASADLDRVKRLDVTTSLDTETGLSLPMDTKALKALIEDEDPALVLLDPLMSRLSVKLDTHKDADVRTALQPIMGIAHDTGVAFLGIIHLNKSGSSDPMNAIMGSAAFGAVARSVLFVMTDPDDEAVRLLGNCKNNLGPLAVTRTFTLEGKVQIGEDEEGLLYSTRLRWGQDRTDSIADVMAAANAAPNRRTVSDDAQEWLEKYLTDAGGTAPSGDLKAAGKVARFSEQTLRRALKKLGGKTRNLPTVPKTSEWSLNHIEPEKHSRASHAGTGTTGVTGVTGTTELWGDSLEIDIETTSQLGRVSQVERV